MRPLRAAALFVSLLFSATVFGQTPNVLLIIADDLGVDRIGAKQRAHQKPREAARAGARERQQSRERSTR